MMADFLCGLEHDGQKPDAEVRRDQLHDEEARQDAHRQASVDANLHCLESYDATVSNNMLEIVQCFEECFEPSTQVHDFQTKFSLWSLLR